MCGNLFLKESAVSLGFRQGRLSAVAAGLQLPAVRDQGPAGGRVTQQSGPAFVQDAVLYSVETFLGWVTTTDAFCDALGGRAAAPTKRETVSG